jgi:ribonuclease J
MPLYMFQVILIEMTLKDMYKWVKPKSIIPVHGEHRHMQEHVSFAKEMQIPKTLLIENGDIIKLLAWGCTPQIIDKAPSGRVYLDGSVNVETDSQSIKDRKNLSVNGYLEITLLVSNNGKIKKPIISFRGIPENQNDEPFIFDMQDEIFNICKTFSLESKNQQKNLNRNY